MREFALLGLAFASLGACATPGPAKVYDFNAMKADRISPGMSRRFVMADQSTMAIYNLRKGVVVPVHSHDSEQLTFVQEGRLRIAVGGQSFDLRQGQVIVIPANAPHSIEALENSVEYDYFAPARRSWVDDRDASSGPPSGPPSERRQ